MITLLAIGLTCVAIGVVFIGLALIEVKADLARIHAAHADDEMHEAHKEK
jgi:hypothetical protein